MFKDGVPEGLAKVETVDGAVLIARQYMSEIMY